MIPDIQAKQVFSNQTATAFGGISQTRTGAFPLILEAHDLSPDAAPFLSPRAAREILSELPGEVQAIYPCRNGFLLLLRTDDGTVLYCPTPAGLSRVPLDYTNTMQEEDLHATRYGRELIFPSLRLAVDLVSRQVRWLDRAFGILRAEYSKNSTGESILTVTLKSGVGELRVGEHVSLYSNSAGETERYDLRVSQVLSDGESLRFCGALPPKEVFVQGTQYLRRGVPYFTRLVACKGRLWGWDGGETLYASAPGSPLSFLTSGSFPEDARGAVVYPEAGEEILAMGALAGQPVCLTARSVVRIAGDTPADYHSEICERYGIAADATETVAVVDDRLFFLGDEGICCYDGRETRLLFSLPHNAGALACGVGTRYVLFDGSERVYILDARTGEVHMAHTDDLPSGLVSTGVGAVGVCGDAGRLVSLYGKLPSKLVTDWKTRGAVLDTESATGSGVTFYPYALPDQRSSGRAVMVEAELGAGASLTVLASFDESEPVTLRVLQGERKRSRVWIPLPPRRCERLTLSLSGTGDYCVYALGIRSRPC